MCCSAAWMQTSSKPMVGMSLISLFHNSQVVVLISIPYNNTFSLFLGNFVTYTAIEVHTNINQANRKGNHKCKTQPTTIFEHSQSQNRWIKAVLHVAFRRVPVCISVVDMYLYLHLLLSVHLTCPLEAPPSFSIPCCNYKRGCNKDTSGLCSQVKPKEIQSHHSESLSFVQLRDEDDIHSGSTGPSAGQGPRHWHQPECCEVLPAGF